MSNVAQRIESDQANAVSSDSFFDIETPPPPGGRGLHIALVSAIGLGTVIAIIALMLSLEGFDPISMALAWLIPLLVVFSVIGYFDHRSGAVLDQKLLQIVSPISRDELREFLTPGWVQLGDRTKKIAQNLTKTGHRGFAVRVFKKAVPKLSDPLDLPFEPIPLDESNEAFADAENSSVPTNSSHSRLRRNIRFGGGWVVFILMGVMLILAGIGSIRRGKISPHAIQFLIIMLVPLFGIGGRGAWRTNRQWLLIPAGIAVRKAGGFKRNWRLCLFKRCDSLLFVRELSRHIWTATVTDANSFATVQMTRRESEMLLRAWLSPLPTPPLEQLSDLT